MQEKIETGSHMYANSASRIPNTLVEYEAREFTPNRRNHRLVGVKAESLMRLNETMARLEAGNAQIYYTMLFKDQDRVKLIKEFWKGMIETDEFKELPRVLQQLEFEQIRKIGPKSRWKGDNLREGFEQHLKESKKHNASRIADLEIAARVLTRYWLSTFRACEPEDLAYYIASIDDLILSGADLPKDSNSGDPYFIGANKEIAGVAASDLDLKIAKNLKITGLHKHLYYTMFKRVQAKGNNLFNDDGTFNEKGESDPWLPEKNRVVQGDSRAYAILGKGIANLFTRLLPSVDPLMAAWADDHRLNLACARMLDTYSESYDFKSFDAENYDASTDPQCFMLGMNVIFDIVRELSGRPVLPQGKWVEHFLYDPTITPWGVYERNSLPSGHIWTNLVGTVTNHLRNIAQTMRLFNYNETQMLNYMISKRADYTPLCLALGDDAVQLVKKGTTPSESSVQDNLDGFGSNPDKTIISSGYFHFLQKGFHKESKIYGYYPASRALESILFQEYANQYTAALVSVNAIAVIGNCQFNPLQKYLINFAIDGDKKYRLGTDIGFERLFKLASMDDKSIAELLDRDWDPKFAGISYSDFGDGIKPTLELISSVAAEIRK